MNSPLTPPDLPAPPAGVPPETPDWVKNAIFYQIFPDRFARSSRMTHLPGLHFKPWGADPEEQGYQGGDLLGIVDKLDYLSELGVTAIYLTPIFSSASNHRYHTYDYFNVDPLLGGNEALRELVDAVHIRQMRIVLDGVFNHTSRGFWQFHHILENGGNSPYIDWFTVHEWPLVPYPKDETQPCNYSAWLNLPALPKFNTKTPAVRQFLYDVAVHWIRFGIDGWRLDVAAEIDDDDFWRTFRQVVKQENPDAYICGEIWHEAKRWLQGDQFDAVMNYVFTGPVISYCAAKTFRNDYIHPHLPFAPFDAAQLATQIDKMYGYYDWEINFAQMNMLDSHDMARVAWIVQDESAQRMCVLFQMTMPGAPSIYYGDEVGMTGGPDPDSRRAFPWHDETQWNHELHTFYQRAIALRRNCAPLRTGAFRTVYAQGDIYAFVRELRGERALVAFNAGESDVRHTLHLDVNPSDEVRQLWPLERPPAHEVGGGTISLVIPARDALVLVNVEK